MALNIRDPEAQQLARELADATGETMTNAVIEALRERLERLRVRENVRRNERAARLMAHGRRFAALPVLDPRTPDELIGYDEVGLPR
ncbi:MAG: type II toxin-antitoxin system VapB family antitoxin [Geminicoccaceae bacterium]